MWNKIESNRYYTRKEKQMCVTCGNSTIGVYCNDCKKKKAVYNSIYKFNKKQKDRIRVPPKKNVNDFQPNALVVMGRLTGGLI